MHVLKPHLPALPNCARTLLCTPRTCSVKQLKNSGEYCHLGLARPRSTQRWPCRNYDIAEAHGEATYTPGMWMLHMHPTSQPGKLPNTWKSFSPRCKVVTTATKSRWRPTLSSPSSLKYRMESPPSVVKHRGWPPTALYDRRLTPPPIASLPPRNFAENRTTWTLYCSVIKLSKLHRKQTEDSFLRVVQVVETCASLYSCSVLLAVAILYSGWLCFA